MTRNSTVRLSATAVLLCSISGQALAQDTAAPEATVLDPILVQGAMSTATGTSYSFSPRHQNHAPAMDGGGVLATIPGVTASRMGGHGLDIVIRGQQANQLNIIDAGALTYGGCPNRMDPPTSTAAFSRADRVIVERGYSSVTNGAGGTGGTVRLEREAPVFDPARRISGDFSIGGTSNSGAFEAGGSIATDLGNGFYLKGSAEYKTADNYEDGAGNAVRSAYDQQSAGLTLGYRKDGLELAFDIENDKAENVLFAGAGMDSPLSDTWVYRLRGGVDLDLGALRRIEGTIYRSEVDHVMDNYSLRPVAGMLMRSPTTSDTTGATLEAQFEFGATKAKLGFDHQSNERRAIGYGGMAGMLGMIEASAPGMARSLSWPDVTIAQTGIYGEAETALSDKTTLKLGARYDHVRATAGAAGGIAGSAAPAPNTFYTAQYGTTFDAPRSEDNLGGLIRLEHDLAPGTRVFAGLSRSVRTADANERAMGRSNWVGNPDIAPEKHHQIDVGIETQQDNWSFNATAYVDRVDDYILRDAFSVAGVTTYRNVSAQLSGVELSGSWAKNGFEVAGDLTYTRGQNRTDDRALAQIPALQGRITASYGRDAWRAGARLNWAAEQDRIDPSRDAGVTPGYGTLDLFGSYAFNDRVMLLAGVNNITDKVYSDHLSRANVFDTTLTRINEPGRTVYVKLEARF